MKDAAYYIKTSILMVLLALESYFLTQILLNYVRSEDYFTPPIQTLGTIALALLVLIYTYALTVGAWKKWEQFVVVPLPISLGVFVGIFFLNPTHAVLVAAVAYILLSYDVYIATTIRDQLIKFNPVTILRFSTRGILFMFSLLAAVLVFLHSSEKNNEFELGSKIAEIAGNQLGSIMQPKLDPSKLPSNLANELDGKGLPLNPELFGLGGMQGDTNSVIDGLPSFNLDLGNTVKTEVNNIIEPYKQFIPPLIALLVYAMVRFLGTFAHIAFNLTVPIVFGIAKKLSFLHSYSVPAEKEELSFTSPDAKPKESQDPKS